MERDVKIQSKAPKSAQDQEEHESHSFASIDKNMTIVSRLYQSGRYNYVKNWSPVAHP